MVFRQVYARPVNRKPACRRHLFSESVSRPDRQPLLPGLCLCDLCPWITVDLWRCPQCGPDWVIRESRVLVCPIPTQATKDSLRSTSGSSAGPSKTFDAFPELWAFLTSTLGPDGQPRLPGRVSLSWDAGLWTLSLNDPSTGLYASLTSQVLDDLVLLVESRLSESTVPWKLSKYAPKGKK
jgi:hypothetical protein